MSSDSDRLRLARLALGLYPAAWRDRYGDEVLALMAQSGGGTRAAGSLAWHAVPAWICPPRHLYADRGARMRASLSTVVLAWSILAGFGLAFALLKQLAVPAGVVVMFAGGGKTRFVRIAPYPGILAWTDRASEVALVVSVLAIAAGALPLWLVMLRRARREHRHRDVTRLLMPVLPPAGYLIAVVTETGLIHRHFGIGPEVFLVYVLAGFAAALLGATGLGLALRSMKPRGPAVRFAGRVALLAVASGLVAAIASSTAVVSLYLAARSPLEPVTYSRYLLPVSEYRQLLTHEPYRSTGMLIACLVLITAAAAVAVVSATRGATAATAQPN